MHKGLLTAALPLLLVGCTKWEPKHASPSPDGSMQALVEYKGSAACCSDHSRVSLLNREGGTIAEPGVVVEASNAAATRPTWIGPNLLVVELCGATEVEAQSRVLRDPVIKGDGSTNEVRVEVVTAADTVRNGRQFCASTSTAS